MIPVFAAGFWSRVYGESRQPQSGGKKMRHFLTVVGAVFGNFVLWSLITRLPVHPTIIYGLVIAVGCLMLYVIVRSGQAPDHDSSTKI
jgi:uncharacterized membrane protein YeaQ/YmgE (transglycosylase-associated protein family)